MDLRCAERRGASQVVRAGAGEGERALREAFRAAGEVELLAPRRVPHPVLIGHAASLTPY